MAFFPNLNVGSLTSQNSNDKKKDPAISVQDEHDCLCAAFSSLRNINRGGGIKTTVLGKDVVCKPWIHFVVGDNSGNNQFGGHFKVPVQPNGSPPTTLCIHRYKRLPRSQRTPLHNDN